MSEPAIDIIKQGVKEAFVQYNKFDKISNYTISYLEKKLQGTWVCTVGADMFASEPNPDIVGALIILRLGKIKILIYKTNEDEKISEKIKEAEKADPVVEKNGVGDDSKILIEITKNSFKAKDNFKDAAEDARVKVMGKLGGRWAVAIGNKKEFFVWTDCDNGKTITFTLGQLMIHFCKEREI